MSADDTALFAEQIGWLANGYLADRSRFAIIAWVGSRLTVSARRRWVRLFPLEHPSQERAEDLLVRVLEGALQVKTTAMRLTEVPDRHVDWSATYQRVSATLTRPPFPYVTRKKVWTPDRPLLGGLLSLGRGWLVALRWATEEALRESGGLRARRDRLESALAAHQRTGLAAAPLDWSALQRLRSAGSTPRALADALTEAQFFWNRAFGASDKDVEALRSLGASLRQADVENSDTLLELTTALSIARAATQAHAVFPERWQDAPWMLSPVSPTMAGKYPPLLLSSGRLRCQITKGTPRRPPPRDTEPVRDLVSTWFDEVFAGGVSRATGRQPDLVLHFWRTDNPKRVLTVLGDAKRNAEGDGTGYLRTAVGVAALYMLAFAPTLGVTLPDSDRGEVRGTLVPTVTLFSHQRAGRSPESAVELLGGERDAVPAVMAFDVASHFGVDSPEGWSSVSLSAWFICLARQAGYLLKN